MGWLRRLRDIFTDERGAFDIGSLFGSTGLGGESVGSFDIGGLDWSGLTGGGLDLSGLTEAGAPTGGSWLDKISGYANAALPVVKGGVGLGQLGLGIASMKQASDAQGALTGAQKQAQQTAAPAAAGAAQLIPAAVQAETTGQLPPELEAQVETAVNSFRQQRLDALVKQGMPAESARAQIEGEVQAYAAQIRAQYAQMLLSGGTDLTAAALGGTGQVAEIAAGQVGGAGNALQGANAALARLLAAG